MSTDHGGDYQKRVVVGYNAALVAVDHEVAAEAPGARTI
jgi:hypothetical protein